MIVVGVTAVGGGIGQAVLRALACGNLRVRTVGLDLSPLSPGLYWADAAYLVPPVSDEPAYIQRLLDICARESLDIIIPGLEFELEPLARHRESFAARGCTVIVSSPRAIQLCRDKHALGRFCQTRGLPFVQTWSLAEAQQQGDELAFPLMVKPRLGGGSVGARLVFSDDELRAIPADNDLVVQPYLPPEDARRVPPFGRLDQSGEISAQFLVGASGEVLGDFISVNRLKDGVPIEVLPDPDSPARSEGLRLVTALAAEGVRGPINLQGRLTPAEVRFFEANARFTGLTGVRAALGYREVDAAIHALALGQEQEARRCLAFAPGPLALRHVEATIVPRERVAQVAGAAAVEQPGTPRRILVTGAAGYIGANLVAALLDRAEVTDLWAGVRDPAAQARLLTAFSGESRLHVVRGDLVNQLWPLPLAGVDVIVHAAGLRPAGPSHDAAAFLLANAEGTRRLLAAARAAGVARLVYLSSQSIYGTSRPPLWSEALPAQPETPYALSKWAGELLCSGCAGRPETVVLRCARVYGQGHFLRWDELPHRFARCSATGQPMSVRGGGHDRLDLLHIRDLCAAIVRACGLPLVPGGYAVFNVGGGQPVSVMQLALSCQALAVECGLPAPAIDMIGPEVEVRHLGMDIRRASAHLGWSPGVGLEEGLGELMDANGGAHGIRS
ncbi:MAG: NAD-dependent epimerase/dehydratase family protein [Chloroflexi bacterium]|nr:NAD-dependent epimerase/dehydratase family protein [Chloroflexota bacterium]MBU1750742.1 NAD-dependent epimerase/dehydratase family protein [Chloroflexota bacterium]MBU1877348.1 NAD-dependent epimerase/dehydratase family protein [Chloroflexota bacterium]